MERLDFYAKKKITKKLTEFKLKTVDGSRVHGTLNPSKSEFPLSHEKLAVVHRREMHPNRPVGKKSSELEEFHLHWDSENFNFLKTRILRIKKKKKRLVLLYSRDDPDPPCPIYMNGRLRLLSTTCSL